MDDTQGEAVLAYDIDNAEYSDYGSSYYVSVWNDGNIRKQVDKAVSDSVRVMVMSESDTVLSLPKTISMTWKGSQIVNQSRNTVTGMLNDYDTIRINFGGDEKTQCDIYTEPKVELTLQDNLTKRSYVYVYNSGGKRYLQDMDPLMTLHKGKESDSFALRGDILHFSFRGAYTGMNFTMHCR